MKGIVQWRGLHRQIRSSCYQLLSRMSSSIKPFSSQQHAFKERELIDCLSCLKEPLTHQSLGSIGMIHSVKIVPSKLSDDSVGAIVKLDTLIPGYTRVDALITLCRDSLMHFPWICSDEVTIRVIERVPRNLNASDESSLSKVEHVIAVSSCKGGVGES